MKRTEFIRICGMGCVGLGLISPAITGCVSMQTAVFDGEIIGADLVIPAGSFITNHRGASEYRTHLIVRNDRLQYPICVFRTSSGSYQAVLMRCTHQGTELQLFGDTFQCPAHGSEFSKEGLLLQGPAETGLRTLPVTEGSEEIKISLK